MPGIEVIPEEHAVQLLGEMLPTFVEYVPAAHGEHAVFPLSTVYVPAGHAGGAVSPRVGLYVPAGHAVQVEAPKAVL